jgi:tight adherence protein B
MRRLATTLVVLSVAAMSAAPATAFGNGAELTQGSEAHFPGRSFVLTVPQGTSVDPQQLEVRENGNSVRDLSISNPDGGDAKLGVVLVIDATETMRGRAIKDAMSAARAFASHRNPQQPLGVITFNADPRTLLPLSTDQSEIDTALASTPSLRARGTHINDAVGAALDLLEGGKVAAGSVVVLSDGADTGSRTRAETVAARANAEGVRIFTVALRSQSFDPSVLRSLASRSGGRYSETTSSRALAGIYEELGSELANQYLIRYRSLAGLDARVMVKVAEHGSILATSEYLSPPRHNRAAVRRGQSGFWRSAAAMVVVSFGCALVLALGILTILAVRPRGRALAERMEGFVSPAKPEETKRWSAALTDSMLAGTEKSLERTRWWTTFKEELEIARIERPAAQIVLGTAGVTVASIWLLAAISGSAIIALLALGLPFAVRAYIKHKLEAQRRLFADQLADNLQVLASAMRAGHSFVGALAVSVEDAAEPARTEFRRVVADEQLGVPIEDALGVVVKRMESRDLEQVVMVATLQRQTGGNTAEVIDRVAETIRERSELRRMVRTLTAQGRMSRWIVTALPVLLLLVITATNPRYMDPLFGTTLGRVMLVMAAGLVAAGSHAIKRIVTIKV